MCLRSKDDPRYDKYPRRALSRACPGYEGRSSTR